MIVVDTGVLAALLLPGRLSLAAEALLRREPCWAAPSSWRGAWRTRLAEELRGGRVSLPQALALERCAGELVIRREEAVAPEAGLRLVAGSGCGLESCEAVVAARQLGVPLVSRDPALLAAFPELAQPL